MENEQIFAHSGEWYESEETERDSHTPNPIKVEESDDNTNTLEQEVDQLKRILVQQNVVIQRLGANLNSSSHPTSTTKPRDVPMLELHQLQGLNATTHLQIFFELVEQCSNLDARRIQIAKGRVSAEIAALIHNHQTLHACDTWSKLKTLLNSHFSKEVNFDRAWQDVNSARYDWSEEPQAFVNSFICQYATLETKFAREKLPNRDKIIKRKLWQGLTSEAKVKLEGFLDEDYPLDKFVDRVEHERQWLEATQTSILNRIKPEGRNYSHHENNSPINQSVNPGNSPQPNATSSESPDLNELSRQIKELTEKVEKLQASPRQTRNEQYCSFCRTSTHQLKDCWRKPPRGFCFDCQRQGCWRGKSNCPGQPSTA